MWGPLPGLLPRALQLPTMARQHPPLPPLPPVQSCEMFSLSPAAPAWMAQHWDQHCSHSPSPGRKSLVIYFIFYTQADVRTADHAQQVRRVTQRFSKLLYPQPKSFSTPQKRQVSRGQRWPDASCIRIRHVERGRLLVPSNTWLSALLDEGHNNQERETRQRWGRREGWECQVEER